MGAGRFDLVRFWDSSGGEVVLELAFGETSSRRRDLNVVRMNHPF